MGRKYDVGIIDCMSKKGCGIATKKQTWNPLSLIGYTQIGTYKGDMSGFKAGDKIKLTYRESTGSFWKDAWNDFCKPNIIKIERLSDPTPKEL